MKKFTLTFVLSCAFCALGYAGPEAPPSGKEMVAPAPPPCDWYRSNEWDISLWGAFAFTGNTGSNDPIAVANAHENHEGRDAPADELNVGEISHDRWLNRDQVWGGGGDIKYFFWKYIGIGLEAYGLGAHTNIPGVAGTLTLRYPIGCTRWAPYIYGGIGGSFGGSQTILSEDRFDEDIFTERHIEPNDSLLEGQIGGGIEYRFTRHIGIMADFTWHFLDKQDNDFGMVRSGFTFAF